VSLLTRLVDYVDGDLVFEGRLVWDDAVSGPRPGVMVAHTIAGRSALEERKAEQLAGLGYVGFAIDAYGKGTQSKDMAANKAFMDALRADRPALQKRLGHAISTLMEQAEVDGSKLAAIGFCFGGLCVLDIARTRPDIAGVVSFHGILTPPGNTAGNKITAKVLVLHGWDDPLATPDAVVELSEELTGMGADWQLHAYGNTMHAFTNPGASDPAGGKAYNKSADRRSWTATQNFLAELFD
jgi:dienelactone hydrolase